MTTNDDDEPETKSDQEQADEATEREEKDGDDYGALLDRLRERRARAPLVTIQTRIETDEESWGEVETDWNAWFTSRPGVRVQARKMESAFTLELPDRSLVDGKRGDWLIREEDTGHVLAITGRAFGKLFEVAVPPATEEEKQEVRDALDEETPDAQ